jgi:hypothetical protein
MPRIRQAMNNVGPRPLMMARRAQKPDPIAGDTPRDSSNGYGASLPVNDGPSLPSGRPELTEKAPVIGPHPLLGQSSLVVESEDVDEVEHHALSVRRQGARR